jgi:hypothetical protein
MAKLASEITKKQWKKCCGHGCEDCKIHNAYLDRYGKKKGHKKFRKDHDKHH